ncbi:hypothetical protein ACLKA6_008112 [Drosophila palustris]
MHVGCQPDIQKRKNASRRMEHVEAYGAAPGLQQQHPALLQQRPAAPSAAAPVAAAAPSAAAAVAAAASGAAAPANMPWHYKFFFLF